MSSDGETPFVVKAVGVGSPILGFLFPTLVVITLRLVRNPGSLAGMARDWMRQWSSVLWSEIILSALHGIPYVVFGMWAAGRLAAPSSSGRAPGGVIGAGVVLVALSVWMLGSAVNFYLDIEFGVRPSPNQTLKGMELFAFPVIAAFWMPLGYCCGRALDRVYQRR